MKSIDQDQFGDDHGGALEVDGLPGVVAKRLDIEQAGLDELGGLRQGPFKVGKKRRVVEGPFRGVLHSISRRR